MPGLIDSAEKSGTQPDQRKRCVIRSYALSAQTQMGSTFYEHHVARTLGDCFDVDLWTADPVNPSVLKYKKLRYLYQTLLEKKCGNYLITGGELFACGLDLHGFDHKTLILYHIGTDDVDRKWLQEIVIRKILNNAHRFDKIVVIAEFWRDFLAKFIDPAKIKVIYCSYPSNLTTEALNELDIPAFKRRFGLPLDRPIIYAGTPNIRKGVVKVLEHLRGEKYFIYTTGRQLIKTDANHFNVNFLDYLRLLSVSDASIFLPDFQEGWTRAAHESLLCGTPIIGLDSGGLGELVHKTNQTFYRSGGNLKSLVDDVITQRKEFAEKAKPFIQLHNDEYFKQSWIDALLKA